MRNGGKKGGEAKKKGRKEGRREGRNNKKRKERRKKGRERKRTKERTNERGRGKTPSLQSLFLAAASPLRFAIRAAAKMIISWQTGSIISVY